MEADTRMCLRGLGRQERDTNITKEKSSSAATASIGGEGKARRVDAMSRLFTGGGKNGKREVCKRRKGGRKTASPEGKKLEEGDTPSTQNQRNTWFLKT